KVSSLFVLVDMVFSLPSLHSVATLPFALSWSDFVRSVQVGCSRFSRCYHLFVDLNFHLFDRSWARQLTQSPELDFGHLLPFAEDFDFMLLPAAGIALWLLLCSGSYTYPLTHK